MRAVALWYRAGPARRSHMTHANPSRIDGRAKTLLELMAGRTFAIDFYQREYAWQDRQVRELVEDLTNSFLGGLSSNADEYESHRYPHYFLGSIVICHKQGHDYVVDGQQRLTSLSLLLIYLHHQLSDPRDKAEALRLVESRKAGKPTLNLNVPERKTVMRALISGSSFDSENTTESMRTIAERYRDIESHFPSDISGQTLTWFFWWLIDHVHLVEIETWTEEDAYNIFETMNDRGLSLSYPEMLKGYLLSQIRDTNDQHAVNEVWKRQIQVLKDLGKDEEVDFFKNMLRARYAKTHQSNGTTDQKKDYERIGSEFHRWIRDHRKALGLTSSNAFVSWVTQDLDFYARQYLRIRAAAATYQADLPSVRTNEHLGFTQQTQLLLAALSPSDDAATITTKLNLVADFLDIWLVRRVWCGRTIAQRNTKADIFRLCIDIRDLTPSELSELLRERLDAQEERFHLAPDFALHKQNYRQVKNILAQMTCWVNQQCGVHLNFDDVAHTRGGRRHEVEHIWANHYERFSDDFSHPKEFEDARNRIGGLLLLQRGINQSLGDASYEAKRDAYATQSKSLLASSLNPLSYKSNPAFQRFIDETGLPFQPFDTFGVQEQQARQVLYIRLAEWVWNPSRLSLDELEPPEHTEIIKAASDVKTTTKRTTAGSTSGIGSRESFWAALLDHPACTTSPFAGRNPTHESWLSAGAGIAGVSFTCNVLQESTRVELFINMGDAAENKQLFDALFAHQAEIESRFGAPISWRRLDGKKTCRISSALELGGWGDDATWPTCIPATLERLQRFSDALGPFVKRS